MQEIKNLLEQLKIVTAKSFEGDPFKDAMGKIVSFYKEHFELQNDEVSIFLTDRDRMVLSFAYPEYLINSGMIPLTSPDAYTVFIYNLGRGTIDNNFNQQKHLHLFETIPTPDKKIKLIWKIMGTVMKEGDYKFGVIEISRKGEEMRESGADFTPENLTFLEITMNQVAPLFRKTLPQDFKVKLV